MRLTADSLVCKVLYRILWLVGPAPALVNATTWMKYLAPDVRPSMMIDVSEVLSARRSMGESLSWYRTWYMVITPFLSRGSGGSHETSDAVSL